MRSNTPYISFFLLQLVLVLHSQAQHLINLGDSVNSKYDEISPVISSDARYLYFVRRNHPENTFGAEDSEDIWYSTALSPNEWSKAQRIPLLNTARYNSVVAISNDDQQLLINGVFGKNSREFLRRGLSTVTRNNDGTFGLPIALNIQGLANMNRGLNTTGTWDGSEKHIVLAFSEKYGSDKYDLYITSQKQDGSWSRPVKMPTLCTKASEEAPCISNDDKTIYFSSDRAEAGKFEIYEAARLDSSWQNWSEPVVAKFPVNTIGYDSHLEFDKKDEYAYLSSNHNTMGGFDLFYVDLKGRPEFITFKGKLIDGKTKKPYSGPFDVGINGRACDSADIVLDSGTFSVKLRTNRGYEIYAHVSGTLPATHKITTSYSNTEQEFIIHFLTDDNDPSATNDQLAGVVRDSTANMAEPRPAGDSAISTAQGSAIIAAQDSTARANAAQGSAIAAQDSTEKANTNANAARGTAIAAAQDSTARANVAQGTALNAARDSTARANAARGTALNAAQDSTARANVAQGTAIITAQDSTARANAARGTALNTAQDSTEKANTNANAARGTALNAAQDSTARANAAQGTALNAARDSKVSASGDSTASTDQAAGNERKKNTNAVRNVGKTITDVSAAVIVNKDNDGVLVKHDLKTGKTVGLVFQNIRFPFNKATFLPGSKNELDYLLKFMKDNPDTEVQIEGHTSSEGNRSYNNRLSLRRALSVQKYLVNKGVAKHRMKVRGFGPSRPFSSNSTAEGRKENRRVEVNIMM